MGGVVLRKKLILMAFLIILDIILMYNFYNTVSNKILDTIEFFIVMFKASLFILSIELCLKSHSLFHKAIFSLILVVFSGSIQIVWAYKVSYPSDFAILTAFTIFFLIIPLSIYSLIVFLLGIIQKCRAGKAEEGFEIAQK